MHYFSSFNQQNLTFASNQSARNTDFKNCAISESSEFNFEVFFKEKLVLLFAVLRV